MLVLYYECMTTITIRNVPEDVRDALAARAARFGQSLQEHVLAELVAATAKPHPSELMDQVTRRKHATGSTLDSTVILSHKDADRR